MPRCLRLATADTDVSIGVGKPRYVLEHMVEVEGVDPDGVLQQIDLRPLALHDFGKWIELPHRGHDSASFRLPAVNSC